MNWKIAIFLLLASSTALSAAVEQPADVTTISIAGEMVVAIFDKTASLSFKQDVAYVFDAKLKPEAKVVPFSGVGGKPRKNIHSLNPAWFDKQARELMDFFVKFHAEPDRLYQAGPGKPYHMLFLVKAFEKILYDGLGEDGKWLDEDKVKQAIMDGYVRDALLFAHKNQLQGKVKNPPHFSSLTRVMQPLMCTFMYGNSWLAIAECYRTSEYFTAGKEIYREYFLNVEVMTVLRRRYHVKASEKDLNGSVLNLSDELFAEYHRECARRWFDKQQYMLSSFEKAKEVKEAPSAVSEAQQKQELP